MNEDLKDSNYLPLSEDEVSLGDEDFIVPEEPVEQEGFKRRLIATVEDLTEMLDYGSEDIDGMDDDAEEE